MTFEDLEREWLRRQRGRRREVTVAVLVILALAGIVGLVGYVFWPRLSELFT